MTCPTWPRVRQALGAPLFPCSAFQPSTCKPEVGPGWTVAGLAWHEAQGACDVGRAFALEFLPSGVLFGGFLFPFPRPRACLLLRHPRH